MIDLETAIRQRDEARYALAALRNKHSVLMHMINDMACFANEFDEHDPTACGVVATRIPVGDEDESA